MTVLLPTAYLPPISYLAICAAADEILVEVWETYPKQTLRNHCEIAGPNGRQRLTIPVTRPDGNYTQTKNIRIAKNLHWQKIHWKSFEAAYNKSPFFLYYQDYFLPFYEKEFAFLLDLNLQLLETLFRAIRLDKALTCTESYEMEVPGATDLRQTSRIQHHCHCEKPKPRVKRSGSVEAAVPGIRLTEYYQVFADKLGFISNLSIVDLLFNLGPETLDYLQSMAPPLQGEGQGGVSY
ncbi:MAG: WbqC family protein [Bacteroidia bacterium]|nr:WbqC family protein [Bacteroidia bacterium]